MGGLILGILAGIVCFIAVLMIKQRMKIDDSLDVFAVHGVGGLLGTLLTAFLALPLLGGLGLAEGVTALDQLWVQTIGVLAVGAWSIVVSFIILALIKAVTPIRVSEEDEIEGLDITSHGERGYNY